VSAVEDRLAEIEGRARENWPTSEDVATLGAALRAVLEVCNEIEPNTFGDSLIEADDIRRAITNVLDVTP